MPCAFGRHHRGHAIQQGRQADAPRIDRSRKGRIGQAQAQRLRAFRPVQQAKSQLGREQILFGRLSEKGGDVFIHLRDDELVFEYEDEPAEAV